MKTFEAHKPLGNSRRIKTCHALHWASIGPMTRLARHFHLRTEITADAQSQAALYWPRHNGRNKSLADSPRSTVNLSHLSQRSDIFGVFSSCLRFGGIGSSVTCNLFRTISSRSALIGLVNTSDLLALDPEGINMMVSTVLERFPLGLLPTVDVRSLSSRQIARNLMEMLRTPKSKILCPETSKQAEVILITQEAETQAAKKARGQEGREHAECIGAQVEMGSDIQNEREREETGAVTPSASSAPFGLKTRHIIVMGSPGSGKIPIRIPFDTSTIRWHNVNHSMVSRTEPPTPIQCRNPNILRAQGRSPVILVDTPVFLDDDSETKCFGDIAGWMNANIMDRKNSE
ncbi:hypothetical protein FIBSPDRAFT_901562 [Athelia psychrophila]|uniref:Uncharacterized protein n=1 Tax=Athelia psychrophila TaxID=1759441 RepID=A0A165X220_9AGAM|nr:hypothetical protein FIBSPDRAFT_901562 [Fibularhizoctonia sp. CBS 109695]